MGTTYHLECDSCGKAIDDMSNRANVVIFTPEPIADPQIDLCPACYKGLVEDPKVKKANKAARDRLMKQQTEAGTRSVTNA